METWSSPDAATSKRERRLAHVVERLTKLLAAMPELRRMAEAGLEASELPGRTERDPDDPGIRSKGSPPQDSTSSIALNRPRLATRSKVDEADKHLLRAIAHLEQAFQLLGEGLDTWDGRRRKF